MIIRCPLPYVPSGSVNNAHLILCRRLIFKPCGHLHSFFFSSSVLDIEIESLEQVPHSRWGGGGFQCLWSDVLTILCLQVVAGMKYIFTVQMARTLCRKGGVVKDCAVHQDPAAVRTTRLAWSQICLC